MPSFAKPAGDSNGNANPLETVWKEGQNKVIDELLIDARARAAEIFRTELPARIASLRKLLKGEEDESSVMWKGQMARGDYLGPTMSTANVEPLPKMEGPIGDHWLEKVPSNQKQREMVDLSQKLIEDYIEILMDIKLWMEMEVPKVEDGNSFGAEVQASVKNIVFEQIKLMISFYNGARQHYGDRVNLIKEWIKYPNVEDLHLAIGASDQFDHLLTRTYLHRMLTCQVLLITKFERNWEKVILPKGKEHSTGGMY